MWTEGLPRPQLFNIEDVCGMFGWDRSTYYRHIRDGKFPRGRRIAGRVTYTREDIDAYILLAGRWEPGPTDDTTTEQTPIADEPKKDKNK